MTRAAPISVLFVDDDHALSYVTATYLEAIGYEVEHAQDGIGALLATHRRPFDVMVLDVDMPQMSGLEVVRRARSEFRLSIPILMLSGRAGLADKLAGLDAGADDYLTKPFATAELRARIEGLVRRTQRPALKERITIGDLTIEVQEHQATRAGRRLEFSPVAWQLLVMLARASPMVVSRERFEDEVWKGALPESDTLRSHIHNLRRIVDRPFARPMIETVVGTGFRLVDPATTVTRLEGGPFQG